MQEMKESRSQEQSTTTGASSVHGDSKVAAPMLQPGMTGQGLLQTLKAKGFSLYGLWGGGQGAGTNPDTSTNLDQASGVDRAPDITREVTPEKYEDTLARVMGRGAATDTDI